MKVSNEPTETTEPLCTIQSIKQLPLKDFIQCSCYEEYEVLTTKKDLTDDDRLLLHNAWRKLLSQYCIAIEDRQAAAYISVVTEMEAIKFRAAYVDFVLGSLAIGFDEKICEILREEYKQLKFTAESYENDMQLAVNIEKRGVHRFNELKRAFDEMEKSKSAEQTAEEKYKGFTNLLFDVNKHEGAQYTRDMSTYDFAVAVRRLEDHYERLEAQSKAA